MVAIPYINGDPETLDLSYGSDLSEDYRVSRVSFGDAYSQRASIGLNPTQQRWRLVWNGISDTDAEMLRLFFERQRGVSIIDWTPYNQAPVNLIRSPTTLSEATTGQGAYIEPIPGVPGANRGILVDTLYSAVYWDPKGARASPGETLFYRHTVYTDQVTTDFCNGTILCKNAAGDVVTYLHLDDTNFGPGAAAGDPSVKKASFVVPDGVASVTPYAERRSSGHGGFFPVYTPYLGRADPDAPPLKWTAAGWSSKPSGYLVQDCSITLTQEFDL